MNKFIDLSMFSGVGGVRFSALVSAMFIYALFGSPTPDSPGWPEILIGGLIVFAIGSRGFIGAVYPFFVKGDALWFWAGKILLLYGVVVGLCMAGLYGHGAGQVFRDIAGFFFLLLPVFLIKIFEERPQYALYFLGCVVALGVMFALRSMLHSFPFDLIASRFFFISDELFYFSNAGSVLLAALILSGKGGLKLMDAGNVRDCLRATAAFGFCVIPVLAMILSVQRATLGSLCLYVIVMIGIALWYRPARGLRVIALLVGLSVFALPMLGDVYTILESKTLAVGVNMRFAEAAAVWAHVSGNIWNLLFGMGWGASFHSPAVGGLSVYYTHNLLSYMVLKTGVVGLGICVVYLYGLLKQLERLVFREPVVGIALVAPVVIGIFFYASFKSLDFGLVLLLIPALLSYYRSNQTHESGMSI